MKITSSHNQKLKEIRKLRQRRRWRERAGQFVAEGEDLLSSADASGWIAIERYVAAGSGLDGVEVEPSLLASASGLSSGTRALAVYEERWAPAPAGPLCVYLHGVHDPGNVGAVLRSAQAFGASSRRARPGDRGPVQPEGGPRLHGRDLRGPARAGRPERPPGREDRARARRRRAPRRTLALQPTHMSAPAPKKPRSWSAPSVTGCRTRSSRKPTTSRTSRSPPTRSTRRWRRRSRCTS